MPVARPLGVAFQTRCRTCRSGGLDGATMSGPVRVALGVAQFIAEFLIGHPQIALELPVPVAVFDSGEC